MAFRKKETTSEDVFVLTVPLHVERWQRDKLDTLFRCCNDMKNALIADRKKALVQMERTRAYRAIQDEIRSIYVRYRALNEPRNRRLALRNSTPNGRKS